MTKAGKALAEHPNVILARQVQDLAHRWQRGEKAQRWEDVDGEAKRIAGAITYIEWTLRKTNIAEIPDGLFPFHFEACALVWALRDATWSHPIWKYVRGMRQPGMSSSRTKPDAIEYFARAQVLALCNIFRHTDGQPVARALRVAERAGFYISREKLKGWRKRQDETMRLAVAEWEKEILKHAEVLDGNVEGAAEILIRLNNIFLHQEPNWGV